MSAPVRIADVFAAGPVIAVATIERAVDAVPLARVLAAGGVRVVEVTLRTNAALAAIEAIAASGLQTIVGAGTVRARADVENGRAAGAQFLVSPGYTAALGEDGQVLG